MRRKLTTVHALAAIRPLPDRQVLLALGSHILSRLRCQDLRLGWQCTTTASCSLNAMAMAVVVVSRWCYVQAALPLLHRSVYLQVDAG